MTPEAKVKKAVVEGLRRLGIYYFFPQTGGYGRSGVPDIVCCVAGEFVALECKAGDNTPTALQAAEMGRIQNAGGVTMVVNEASVDAVITLLRLRMKAKAK